MTNYTQYVNDALESGKINKYMADKLSKAIDFGMTDYLLDCAIENAKHATKHGVESDEDYNVMFFIINTAEDFMEDTFGANIGEDEKDSLCKHIIESKRKGEKLEDLTDFRVAIHKWLCDKHTKKAYPNTFGKDNREPTYDTQKWINTTKVVYSLLNEKNIDREAAIELATVDWDSDERFKFDNWLKYYESGNTERYNVKTAAPLDIYDLGLPSSLLDPKTRSNNPDARPLAPYKKTKREEELERAKAFKEKMKSRIRSLRRLLDRYNDILPEQDIESVQDEMYALDKSISKLNVYASLEDRIIRSANKIEKLGFKEGAEELRKFADDPSVESAVEHETGEEQQLPKETQSKVNVDISMVIHRLEGITELLKSRGIVRDMASVDILLNELGMASYFPELGDSQSKLIEAFSYASNRVDDILSKLRGTKPVPKHPAAKEKEKAAPIAKPENIDKRELATKPIGKMQKELPTG